MHVAADLRPWLPGPRGAVFFALWLLYGAALFAGPVRAFLPERTPALRVARIGELAVPAPTRLSIASIGVDAPILPVSQDIRGNMGVPDRASDIGWYALGTVPGQPGTALLAGHVQGTLGVPGVFHRLHELKPESSILIEDAAGGYHIFRVRDVRRYAATQAPLEEIFGPSDTPVLRLITCAGRWMGSSFSERLVVTAVPLNQ